MNYVWIIIDVLVVVAIVLLAIVLAKAKRRGMSSGSKSVVQKALEQAVSQSDPVRRVLAMDAVLDLALTQLGFSGSLGEKLKKAGPRIPTIQAVWDAHKLRNRLAHEHDANVNQAETDRAVRILDNAIRSLLQ